MSAIIKAWPTSKQWSATSIAGPQDLRKHHDLADGLTIVFAALAVSRWIESTTGWSIRRFVKTARRYRTIQVQAGQHTITAADPLPGDLRNAIDAINGRTGGH